MARREGPLSSFPRILITLGDPRGVGPEVAFKAVRAFIGSDPDPGMGTHAGTVIAFATPDGIHSDETDTLAALKAACGSDAEAGAFAAGSIEYAVERARGGAWHAIVTAPAHKPSLHAAGWEVPGQTEMLQALAGVEKVGMLMAAETTPRGAPLRVLLATTHHPLRSVVALVTEDLLFQQTRLLHEALRTDWGIASPRIALCALNPHASDGGLFGDEETRVYAPALERLGAAGTDVTGPLPADTVFQRALAGTFDAVVAPYHDVGMAAFKTVAFGSGVNVTLGLPFVRTSPDHGTAFDIAGTGRADPSSMLEAVRLAARLAAARFDTDSGLV